MADSTTEVSALENRSAAGGLQLRVAALCMLVQMCDGYDLNSVAWAVPSLFSRLAPAAIDVRDGVPVVEYRDYGWSALGGPIGDRFGRRPLLLASLTIFGIASLLSAVAGSLSMLSLLRFFTGLASAVVFQVRPR